MLETKKTYPLTIYLIKERLNEVDKIVKNGLVSVDINKTDKFFYSSSHRNEPGWLGLFSGFDFDNIFSASGSGLFLTKSQERYFAIPFGPSGRHYLQRGVIEERFGLITVLNSVKKDTLRCVDLETLETEGMQTRVQSSKPMTAEEFGLDVERDFVKSVVGESEEELFGKTLIGKDSFKMSAKCDLNDIGLILTKSLERYNSDRYKTDFSWIDNLKEIKDPNKIEEYNKKLIEEINKNATEKLWLTIPEILDWADHGGFKYSNKKDNELLDDIHISSFKEHVNNKPLSLESLKDGEVYRFSSSNEYEKDHWHIYDCIYFEYSNNGITCILTGGKWYEVKNNLVEEVEKYWQEIVSRDNYGINFIDYDHDNENLYNESLASENNALCLDGKEIQIYGKSKFEFCDVYTKDRKIIHIKRYSGSGTLSHLFNQGYVSSEFLFDPLYREKINNKLSGDFKIQDVKNRPNSNGENYTIIYGVASKSSGVLNLPFFSKLTFMNIARKLLNHGYIVSIVKIKNIRKDKEE